MHLIEALDEFSPSNDKGEYVGSPSIFLAGGITGCLDWQSEIINKLENVDVILLNPRRKNFPINDPDSLYYQVKWEYEQLRKATAILFWFSKETLCPITLFELGKWVDSNKPIFVGTDLEYKRRADIVHQTVMARGKSAIFYSTLDALVIAVKEFVEKYKR